MEKLRLRDIREDVNSNPKAGNTLESMKKELRKMKVIENCEDLFKKESSMYYVRNDENRSKHDKWKNDLRSRGYVRSDSNPKFFRTALKNRYVQDDSRMARQRSNMRSNLRTEIYFPKPRNNV